MKLSKIASYLLTTEEKKKLADQEISFLKKAVEVRDKLLERISVVADRSSSLKDLAKALETLSNEIKQSYRNIGRLTSPEAEDNSLSVELEELQEMEKKLNELEQFQ